MRIDVQVEDLSTQLSEELIGEEEFEVAEETKAEPPTVTIRIEVQKVND